jgi:hypothetical protein
MISASVTMVTQASYALAIISSGRFARQDALARPSAEFSTSTPAHWNIPGQTKKRLWESTQPVIHEDVSSEFAGRKPTKFRERAPDDGLSTKMTEAVMAVANICGPLHLLRHVNNRNTEMHW